MAYIIRLVALHVLQRDKPRAGTRRSSRHELTTLFATRRLSGFTFLTSKGLVLANKRCSSLVKLTISSIAHSLFSIHVRRARSVLSIANILAV